MSYEALPEIIGWIARIAIWASLPILAYAVLAEMSTNPEYEDDVPEFIRRWFRDRES